MTKTITFGKEDLRIIQRCLMFSVNSDDVFFRKEDMDRARKIYLAIESPLGQEPGIKRVTFAFED